MLLMASSALRNLRSSALPIPAPGSLPHEKASCLFPAVNLMGDFLVMACDVHKALQNRALATSSV